MYPEGCGTAPYNIPAQDSCFLRKSSGGFGARTVSDLGMVSAQIDGGSRIGGSVYSGQLLGEQFGTEMNGRAHETLAAAGDPVAARARDLRH